MLQKIRIKLTAKPSNLRLGLVWLEVWYCGSNAQSLPQILLWLQMSSVTDGCGFIWPHFCTAGGSGDGSAIHCIRLNVSGSHVLESLWVRGNRWLQMPCWTYVRFLRMQCVEEILKRGMVKDKSWTYGWVYDLEGKSRVVTWRNQSGQNRDIKQMRWQDS